jgi:hypothetical protein
VWAGTDEWRAESVLVTPAAGGFAAVGVQLGIAPLPYRLEYRLTVAGGWMTRSVELEASGAGWRRTAHLSRGDGGAWSFRAESDDGVVDLPEPACYATALGDALDCDLGFSPLTNTMPVVREALHREPGAATFTTAWISVPDLAVHASVQSYEHQRRTPSGSVVRFSSGAFTADLILDGDGFVVDYPDLARRVLAPG